LPPASPRGRLNALRRDPRVAYVEADQVVSVAAQTTPTGVRRIFADKNLNLDIDGTDDKRIDVDVAVIDTGIDLQHTDLNVYRSTNCSGGSPTRGKCGSGGDDDNGHGSHVAGSVGALDNGVGVVGVAPGARLWGVKVLSKSGSGYTSWIIAGIDYVTANAAQIEVANMSLGCECKSDAQDAAIAKSVAAGVTYVVAAGNDDKDSVTFSPANHPDVITVSALADFNGDAGGLGAATCRADEDDTLANFSNFGKDVEIAAPGVCILSTWFDGAYNTISGTSMASPHAAGAAALLAASGIDSPSQIRQTLVAEGNLNWTDDSGDGVQERLLDVSDTAVFKPATVSR
jgi:subtilisin family serine protease